MRHSGLASIGPPAVGHWDDAWKGAIVPDDNEDTKSNLSVDTRRNLMDAITRGSQVLDANQFIESQPRNSHAAAPTLGRPSARVRRSGHLNAPRAPTAPTRHTRSKSGGGGGNSDRRADSKHAGDRRVDHTNRKASKHTSRRRAEFDSDTEEDEDVDQPQNDAADAFDDEDDDDNMSSQSDMDDQIIDDEGEVVQSSSPSSSSRRARKRRSKPKSRKSGAGGRMSHMDMHSAIEMSERIMLKRNLLRLERYDKATFKASLEVAGLGADWQTIGSMSKLGTVFRMTKHAQLQELSATHSRETIVSGIDMVCFLVTLAGVDIPMSPGWKEDVREKLKDPKVENQLRHVYDAHISKTLNTPIAKLATTLLSKDILPSLTTIAPFIRNLFARRRGKQARDLDEELSTPVGPRQSGRRRRRRKHRDSHGESESDSSSSSSSSSSDSEEPAADEKKKSRRRRPHAVTESKGVGSSSSAAATAAGGGGELKELIKLVRDTQANVQKMQHDQQFVVMRLNAQDVKLKKQEKLRLEQRLAQQQQAQRQAQHQQMQRQAQQQQARQQQMQRQAQQQAQRQAQQQQQMQRQAQKPQQVDEKYAYQQRLAKQRAYVHSMRRKGEQYPTPAQPLHSLVSGEEKEMRVVSVPPQGTGAATQNIPQHQIQLQERAQAIRLEKQRRLRIANEEKKKTSDVAKLKSAKPESKVAAVAVQPPLGQKKKTPILYSHPQPQKQVKPSVPPQPKLLQPPSIQEDGDVVMSDDDDEKIKIVRTGKIQFKGGARMNKIRDTFMPLIDSASNFMNPDITPSDESKNFMAKLIAT